VKARRLQLTPASAIPVRPVHWVWTDRLALSTLALLAGREGIGKTILAYTLAAAITKGTLEGTFYGVPKPVIVCATEDSWAQTIVPRLMAAGADLDLLFRIDVLGVAGTESALLLPTDLEELEAVITDVGAALVILDPLLSRLSSTLDTHKDAEVRQALEPLANLADSTRCTVLGLIHLNKSTGGDLLTSVMASRAFAAVARAVLFVVQDPDDEGRRLLGVGKNNLGRVDLPTLAFTIGGAKVADTLEGEVWTGRLQWVGEACKRAGCKDRELLRITEKLSSTVVKNKFLHSTRAYDETFTPEEERWIRNAVAHQGTPNAFHAIVTSQNAALRPDVIVEEDVDESHPMLDVPREVSVLREAAALAGHVRLMVRNSNSLILVDPHFEPWLDRWWAVIKACLNEAARAGRAYQRLEIHVLETDTRWNFAEFERRCHRNAIAFVPSALKGVRVFRWRLKRGGPDDFHERYLLTDRGGYRLGKGLDEEVGVNQPVSLLDDQEWRRLWTLFANASTSYEKCGEVLIP
jgi:hypothetical protein